MGVIYVSDTAVCKYVQRTLSRFKQIIIFHLHSVANQLTDIN